MTKTKIVLLAIAILVVALVAGAFIGSRVSTSNCGSLGAIVNDASYLVGDVFQGSNQTLEFRNGKFVGPTLQDGTTTLNSFTMGGILTSTSTKFGTVTVNLGTKNFPVYVGESCAIGLTTAPTSTAFGADGFVSAIGANTSTVAYTLWNGTSSVVTVATGTLNAICF